MQQLKMYLNQRLFNAGLHWETIKKGDIPAKGWTTLFLRITLITTVVMIIGAFGV